MAHVAESINRAAGLLRGNGCRFRAHGICAVEQLDAFFVLSLRQNLSARRIRMWPNGTDNRCGELPAGHACRGGDRYHLIPSALQTESGPP